MLSAGLRTLAASLLLLVLSASCASSTMVNTPTVTSVFPTETSTLVPVPTDAATATAVIQAPFCVWDQTPTPNPAVCALPVGDQRDQFCVNKIPYTLIAIPAGYGYQVTSAGFKCDEAGVKSGFQLLTCTGPRSYTFHVQVCNTTCAIPTVTATLAAASGRCPSGYDYLADRQCCQAAVTPNGCVTLSFDTSSCGYVDCSQFTTSSSCASHNTCKWIVPQKANVLPYCASR